MYFKNSVPFTERTDLVLPNVEATWAEINLNNKKVLHGCFYIHPRFQEWNLVELCIEQALQSDVAINIDILLRGCPLYSGEVNEQIFQQVHSFIIQSNRFS